MVFVAGCSRRFERNTGGADGTRPYFPSEYLPALRLFQPGRHSIAPSFALTQLSVVSQFSRSVHERCCEVSGEMVACITIRANSVSAHFTRLLAIPLRTLATVVSILIAISAAARADDFWKNKPPAQWSAEQALKLVRRSPWARMEVVAFLQKDPEAAFSIPTGTKHCDPDAIDQNGNCMQKGRIEAPVDSSRQMDAAPMLKPWAGILVRWESATPVAQAFTRLEKLDEGPALAFQAPPPRLPADRYVVTAVLERPGGKGFDPFAVTPAGKPVLVAKLKTRRGIVVPLEVEFTGVGASSSVHYFFPRMMD